MKQFPMLQHIPHKIEAVELFRIDVSVARHFSFGVWKNRQHGLLKITAGGHSGWGEEIMSLNREDLDVFDWAAGFDMLCGMTVSDALQAVREQLSVWGARKTEMAEMALLDLAGRLTGKPTLELLGLSVSGSIPGMQCVLENDPQKVREGARLSLDHHYTTHLKVKLFGDLKLDCEIVRTAREVMGNDAYLVGDVNTGYREQESAAELGDIADAMRALAEAGLDGCEDPAKLTHAQWVELQRQAEAIDLIPDYPMRPAHAAARTIIPGMGRIYNIHPGSAGSLLDAIRLAARIREIGGKLMIGDNSLIGPACGVWQQMAIGLQAEWVEAVEKPLESVQFLQACSRRSVFRDDSGRLAIDRPYAGFGLEMDEAILRAMAKDYAMWAV